MEELSRRLSLPGGLALAALVLATSTPTDLTAHPLKYGREPPALRKFLETYTTRSGHDLQPATFSISTVDLNRDGTPEIIVYISGGSWCGSGGCDMLVLEPRGTSFKVVGETTIIHLPIRELRSRHHGWHDIGVIVAGGGIRSGYEAALPFDGRRYPGNPTMPPAHAVSREFPGRVLIGREAPGGRL